MIRLTCISNLLSFYTICFWTEFSSILFAFANLREKIWAHDLHCGENSFSMAARYPDWVDEMMGEALWWEIWFIVNKPKRNVELKSVIDEVHCKREKCCASAPFTWEAVFSEVLTFFHRILKNFYNVKACRLDISNTSFVMVNIFSLWIFFDLEARKRNSLKKDMMYWF